MTHHPVCPWERWASVNTTELEINFGGRAPECTCQPPYWLDYHFPWCCIWCCEMNERLVTENVGYLLPYDWRKRS